MNRKKVVIATAVTVIVAAIGMFSLLATRERSYDRAFDSQVRDPAYRTSGPIVLFDESHLNTHTTTGGYRPLAELLRNDGYRLRVSRQRLSLPELEGVSILVLALARGANDANDDPAYSEAEEVVIEGWVRSGGSLLLITTTGRTGRPCPPSPEDSRSRWGREWPRTSRTMIPTVAPVT